MKALLIIFFPIIWCCSGILADTADSSFKPETKTIIQEIEDGNEEAILKLGNVSDKAVIPYLQKLKATEPKYFRSKSSYAQMALAKLGEKKEWDEIVAELDRAKADKIDDLKKAGYQSPEGWIQNEAVEKMAYIGGDEAIKKLAPYLDDPKYLKFRGTGKGSSLVLQPLNVHVIEALAKIVSNPPKTLPMEDSISEEYQANLSKNIQLWRDWWKTNRSKYSK